jgi:hypothetical protein
MTMPPAGKVAVLVISPGLGVLPLFGGVSFRRTARNITVERLAERGIRPHPTLRQSSIHTRVQYAYFDLPPIARQARGELKIYSLSIFTCIVLKDIRALCLAGSMHLI